MELFGVSKPPEDHQPPKVPPPKAEEWAQVAKQCILFDGLPKAEMQFMQQSCKLVEAFAGVNLYEQEDAPSYFYLIHSGRYRAHIKSKGGGAHHSRESALQNNSFVRPSVDAVSGRGTSIEASANSYRRGRSSFDAEYSFKMEGRRKTRSLGPGDNFGACEMLCLMGGRTATVTCVESGYLWAIPQRVVTGKLKIPPPKKAAPSMVEFLGQVKMLSGISKERLVQLSRAAETMDFKDGDIVVEEGDKADELWICKEGSVVTEQSTSAYSLVMNPPDAFGEVALFPEDASRIRQTRIRAQGNATLVRLKTASVETLIGYELQEAAVPIVHRKLLSSSLLGSRSFVQGLRKDDVDSLLAYFEETTWDPKETVVSEGEFDEALFLIKRGTAIVKRGTSDIAQLTRGDMFGEQALLPPEMMKHHKRKTTILAAGGNEDLVTLSLTSEGLSILKASDPLSMFGLAEGSMSSGNVGLASWADQLLIDINTGAMAGVDAAVVLKVEAAGKSINDVIPAGAKAAVKKEKAKKEKASASPAKEKKGKKNGGRRSSIVGRLVRRASKTLLGDGADEQDGDGDGAAAPRRNSLLGRLSSRLGGSSK